MRTFLLLGAINAFVAVALGAFGAHELRNHVPIERIATWNTGAQYQMYHALGLILIAALYDRLPIKGQGLARTAGYLFAAGCVIFAGSLYALTLSGVKILGAITPIGGVCFLSGWVLLTVAAASLTVSPPSSE
ncbi:MAG: DUF423 domain-containing protein [Akkermansiaceae bacterium]|nr:DUF423 domain-containing protein [Armatimonadota bacterium]